MKLRMLKGFMVFVLCISIVLSNIQFADAALTDATLPVGETIGTIPKSTEVPTAEIPITEPTPVITFEEDPKEEEPVTEEVPTPAVLPEIVIEDVTISENSVSENKIINPNAIKNLKQTGDGTAYILEKTIEEKEVTIYMYIPLELFTEAEELSFEAIPVTEEQEKMINEAFVSETEENNKLVIKGFAAYDINLFVDGVAVSDFEGSVKIVFDDQKMLVTETEEETIEVYYFNEEKQKVEILETQQEEGTAAAEVEHFSIYGYRVLESWERDLTTREGIIQALGLSRYFSVFTSQFSSTSHMEGTVAIENLKAATNIELSDQLFDAQKHATDFSVTLTKNIESSVEGGTFQFVFYEQNDSATTLFKQTAITIPQGSTSGSVTIEGFRGTKVYYVYELDTDGETIRQNQIGVIGGNTYQTTYSTNAIDLNTNIITGTGNISYIKNVSGSSNAELFISNKITPEVVFGENNEIFLRNGADNMPCVRTKGSGDGGYLLKKETNVHIAGTSEYPKTFPIDFEKEFAALKEVSAGLVSMGSGNDIKVVNANVDGKGYLNLEGKNYTTEGKLLIINVNCKNYSKITWSKSPKIDGVGDDNWSKKYSNVLYNFYNSGKNAYTGTIDVQSAVHGTVFAPGATFITGSNVVGNIIAKSTQLGGEVHQMLLTDDSVSRNIKVQCTNKDCGETTSSQSADKSVRLVDWDERTYQIGLYADAEKTTKTTVVNTRPIDAVLVLDISGSMAFDIAKESGDSYERLNALKKAVKGFITKTAEVSPESRIAIITFNTVAETKIGFTKVNESGIRQLFSQVSDLKADGGTRQDKGLLMANSLVNSSYSENDIQVILFSDGVPDDSEWSGYAPYTQYQYNQKVEQAATIIKNNQKIEQLYSIFLGEDNGKMPTARDYYDVNNHPQHHYGSSNVTYRSWFINTIPSEGCGYTANSADALLKVFEKIGSSIVEEFVIIGTIIDVIDSRFDLLDDKNNPVTVAAVRESGATGLAYQDARLYIEAVEKDGITREMLKLVWENVIIPSKTAGGWSRTIPLRAKDDYIGGNDIPTNGTGSGVLIDIDGDGQQELQPFPRPTVNVKVQFEIPDAEDVFFLGEQIGKIYTEEDIIAKYLSKTAEGMLILKHSSSQAGTETADEYTDGRDVTIHTLIKSGITNSEPKMDTVYKEAVTVSVVPNQAGSSSAGNMIYSGEIDRQEDGVYDTKGNKLTLDENGEWYYTVCNSVTDSGDYTAYIVDGTLDITKRIDRKYEKEIVSKAIKDRQSFIFKIERYNLINGSYVKDEVFGDVYETIQFTLMDGLSETRSLIGLREGYYKVTEETDWSWKYDQHTLTVDGADEQGFVHIGERDVKEDKSVFRGLDTDKRQYSGAGRYDLLPDSIKEKIDISLNHIKVNFEFKNLFTTDTEKKKLLGDVSIMRNIFQ